METAKVDIRKLQLLNDRINQCIDALGQVRLSVHGLSHSSPQQFQGQPSGSPYPQSGQQGFFGQGQGQGFGSPYGPGQGSYLGQGQNPFPGGGMMHSSMNPFQPFQQMSPYGQGWGQQPFAQQGTGQQGGYGQQAWGQQPWGQQPGLSHSGPESGGDIYSRLPLDDPFVAMRIAQTFPYVQYPQPPGPIF